MTREQFLELDFFEQMRILDVEGCDYPDGLLTTAYIEEMIMDRVHSDTEALFSIRDMLSNIGERRESDYDGYFWTNVWGDICPIDFYLEDFASAAADALECYDYFYEDDNSNPEEDEVVDEDPIDPNEVFEDAGQPLSMLFAC